jgi:hypothetical protein
MSAGQADVWELFVGERTVDMGGTEQGYTQVKGAAEGV